MNYGVYYYTTGKGFKSFKFLAELQEDFTAFEVLRSLEKMPDFEAIKQFKFKGKVIVQYHES